MEGTPYFPESHEDASIETPEKKKEKKKKRGFEFVAPEKRKEEAKKIAESLEKSPLFGDKRPEKEKDQKLELKHLVRPEAASETDAPLDGMAAEEVRETAQESAAQWRADIEVQMAELEPGSPEAQMAEAVMEDLKRIEETGVIDPEAATKEPETGAEPMEMDLSLDAGEGEILLSDSVEGAPEDEDTSLSSATASASPAPPLATGGGSTGGTRPPSPPGPPTPPGPGHNPQPNPNVWPMVPQRQRTPAANLVGGPNTAPNPNLYTSAEVAQFEQMAGIRGALVGGIIGYLLGRRRGRIKTEKRLLPVQHKLEKEVKSLQEQLEARQYHIRTLAFERLPEAKKAEYTRAHRRSSETGVADMTQSRLGLEKPVRIERLGKAVVGAEMPAEITGDLRRIQPEHVRAMSHNELLLVSDKIVIEGATLRQIYEQHLIGERGLRRLVAEYLQGKDIHKDLHKEMVEREIDFERDPILRDAALASTAMGGGKTVAVSLDQLLEKAGAKATPDDALLPVAKLQAAAKEEAAEHKRHNRMLLDTAMVTLIVVLAAAVTILLLRR